VGVLFQEDVSVGSVSASPLSQLFSFVEHSLSSLLPSQRWTMVSIRRIEGTQRCHRIYNVCVQQVASGATSLRKSRLIPNIRTDFPCFSSKIVEHSRYLLNCSSVGLSDTPGLLVQSVAVPSPASRAGLQEGDLIVSAGGAETRSIEGLYEQLVKA
jgi:membrane-associated protease RseP (regulator of RpoE activity)